MICPSCGTENLQGSDECENCGADLRTADIPAPSTEFEASLVNEPIADLRPTPPAAVAPDTSVAEAVRLMREESIGCVVVQDAGGVRGILSERDLVMKLDAASFDGATVGQLMTPDPVVLRADDSIAVAIHKMALGGFRHIPLVEDGRATGIISARDVFRHLLANLG